MNSNDDIQDVIGLQENVKNEIGPEGGMPQPNAESFNAAVIVEQLSGGDPTAKAKESVAVVDSHQDVDSISRMDEIRKELSEADNAGPERPTSEFWGNVTDPRFHDPGKFRYLVHAFDKYNEAGIGLMLTGTEHSEAQAVDLLLEPSRVAERVSLSMSLIDEAHTSVWGFTGGLIIRAPASNIQLASPTDASVVNADPYSIKVRAGEVGELRDPDAILRETQPGKHNEIVALGEDASGNKLQVDGIFYIVDEDGDVPDMQACNRLRSLATENNLPLVEIPYGEYVQEGIFEISQGKSKGKVAHYQGKEYVLDHSWKTPFEVSTGVKTYFAAPEEAEGMISHFIEVGIITPTEAQELRETYNNTYRQKMKPSIGNEGEISYITFRNGVGKNFIEYNFRSGKLFKTVHRGSVVQQSPITVDEINQALESDRNNISEDEYTLIKTKLPS